jgi:hypothetical protein
MRCTGDKSSSIFLLLLLLLLIDTRISIAWPG